MNIVVSSCWYAITAASEYFLRAFKRREDCRVITVGPYPGLWMPWSKNGIAGMVMPDNYDCKPDIPLPYNGGLQSAPINYIENLLPKDFTPDLWFDVNAGFYLEGVPKNGIRAMFLTDPHTHLRQVYDSIKPYYQFYFNPQLVYSKDGEYYLPYAADPIWHSPIENSEKLYDVTLIGNTYANRVQLMDNLKNQGKNIFFELGYGKEDARRIYSQSKIGVNWSSMNDLTARIFEIASLGIAPVYNYVPDLSLFEEDKEYLGFNSLSETNEKINYLLANPEKMAEMGKNARNKIISEHHTYDDRVETILKVCGLTN